MPRLILGPAKAAFAFVIFAMPCRMFSVLAGLDLSKVRLDAHCYPLDDAAQPPRSPDGGGRRPPKSQRMRAQVFAQMLTVAVGGNATFHYSLPFRYFGESVGGTPRAKAKLRRKLPPHRTHTTTSPAQVSWHYTGNTCHNGVHDTIAPYKWCVANEHPCTGVTCPSVVRPRSSSHRTAASVLVLPLHTDKSHAATPLGNFCRHRHACVRPTHTHVFNFVT